MAGARLEPKGWLTARIRQDPWSLNTNTAQKIFKTLAESMHWPLFTSYTLRRSFATFHASRMPDHVFKYLMGHDIRSNLGKTVYQNVYTGVDVAAARLGLEGDAENAAWRGTLGATATGVSDAVAHDLAILDFANDFQAAIRDLQEARRALETAKAQGEDGASGDATALEDCVAEHEQRVIAMYLDRRQAQGAFQPNDSSGNRGEGTSAMASIPTREGDADNLDLDLDLTLRGLLDVHVLLRAASEQSSPSRAKAPRNRVFDDFIADELRKHERLEHSFCPFCKPDAKPDAKLTSYTVDILRHQMEQQCRRLCVCGAMIEREQIEAEEDSNCNAANEHSDCIAAFFRRKAESNLQAVDFSVQLPSPIAIDSPHFLTWMFCPYCMIGKKSARGEDLTMSGDPMHPHAPLSSFSESK